MCQHKHLRHKKITFRGYLTRHSGAQRPPLIYEFEVLSMKTRRLIFAAAALVVPVVGVLAFQSGAEARLSAKIERQFIAKPDPFVRMRPVSYTHLTLPTTPYV